MMDIVKRLRDRGVCSIAQNSCRNDFVCEQAADTIETLCKALSEIEVFAGVRSKDDSKTFARVNRGALRTIAAAASKALAKAGVQ
jgi:hypothetical protein